MKEAKAILRSYRMGPRKMRLLADLVRGRRLVDALERLSLANKKAARVLFKLLKSAAANAKSAHSLEPENLRVKTIFVDGGAVLKRWMPRAHGRATPIRERTSSVTVVLEETVTPEKKKKEKKEKAAKPIKKSAKK